MTALFGSRCLIFDVDSCSTTLNKQLGQLHYGCETAMAGVCIGDNGPQKVRVCNASPICFRCGYALLPLLTIVEELGQKELVYLVWDCVLRKVSVFSTYEQSRTHTMG